MIRAMFTWALVGVLLVDARPAEAHGDKHRKPSAIDYSKAQEKPFGRASDPKKAQRTIRVDMSDTMRFSPAELTVRRGEVIRFRVKNSGKVMHEIVFGTMNDTVRFVVKNSGKQMHEMVLGTMQELKEHAALMRKHPGMEHDEPWMAHVGPGKTSEMGWQFTRPGTYYYGCLIPGHFEAGMIGKVIVK